MHCVSFFVFMFSSFRRSQSRGGPTSISQWSSTAPKRWCLSAASRLLLTSLTTCTTLRSCCICVCMLRRSTCCHAYASRLVIFIKKKKLCLCLCQTTVISVRQTTNFEVTGQWEVETESREGQRETRVFDAVMVCTGHFTQPHLPLRDFPGKFKKCSSCSCSNTTDVTHCVVC